MDFSLDTMAVRIFEAFTGAVMRCEPGAAIDMIATLTPRLWRLRRCQRGKMIFVDKIITDILRALLFIYRYYMDC